MYANVQIKKKSNRGANVTSTHILREGEKYKKMREIATNIILKKPTEKFAKIQKDTSTRKEKLSETNRQKKLKTVNAKIPKYEERINSLLPDEEQQYIKN